MNRSFEAYELCTSIRWYDALKECQQLRLPHVLISIVKVSGSAPRDLSTKMVITETDSYDTIGGGGLEFEVIKTARALMTNIANLHNQASIDINSKDTSNADNQPEPNSHHKSILTKHYPLGAKLGQCCGGSVTVMFETFNLSPPLSLLLFGAGHVAHAMVSILSQMTCQVDWIDNRPEIFDKNTTINNTNSVIKNLPAHIKTHISDDPTEFIRPYSIPRYLLVMTHDHLLDFKLIKKAIEVNKSHDSFNKPLPYIGCIGSNTKAKRFQHRLMQRGFSEMDITQLHMPIGLNIGGKEPMAVAVSIMAQVLQLFHKSKKSV